jgi:hypothetical protein
MQPDRRAAGPKIRWRETRHGARQRHARHGAASEPARFPHDESRTPEHPIMKGLPTVWLHANDELYSNLRGPAKNVTVLATATAPDVDAERHRRERARHHGDHVRQGRVFHDTLGHVGRRRKSRSSR